MDTQCTQCQQKDDLIHKYLKLIKLLKTKCQKSTRSFTKKNTLPSETLYESSLQNSESAESHLKNNVVKSIINPEKVNVEEEKIQCQLNLAIMILANRMRKTLLKQSFCELKKWKSHQNVCNVLQTENQQTNLSGSIISFVEETLARSKNLSLHPPTTSLKSLHQQILHLQLQNSQLTRNFKQLQQQLHESQKRLLKQTQKKREYLETFGQEIRQKTETINELQYTIKQYQKMFGKKVEGNVLDEDLEEVNINCRRLETVNQKLNDMLKGLEQRNQALNKKVEVITVHNSQLKEENKSLKQKLFDLSHQLTQLQQLPFMHTNLIKKLNKKFESLKNIQKQLVFSMKKSSLDQSVSPIILNSKIVSTKNTDLSTDDIDTHSKKLQLKGLQAQQKIEEIFAFLFNIKDQDHKIQNEEIFDQDEKELLRSHKQIFISNLQEDPLSKMNRSTLKKDINIDESHFKPTDEVFYSRKFNFQRHQNSQDNTLLHVFNVQKPVENIPFQQNNNQMKLIELKIEKSKLIEKISELKNLHMHIRNVVLNFMKSIDLTALRPQTGSIMELMFEFFQYSEDEKASIFKDKKKKFWGLL